jgi:hypothetical protein
MSVVYPIIELPKRMENKLNEFYEQREAEFQKWFAEYGELYAKLEEDQLKSIFEWGFTAGAMYQLKEDKKRREAN